MKANRKFVEEKEAVSAVIGVILMVAITVAIAATVYVYVSGMIGPESKKAENASVTGHGLDGQIKLILAQEGQNYPSTGYDTTDVKIFVDGIKCIPIADWEVGGQVLLGTSGSATGWTCGAAFTVSAGDYSVTVNIMDTVVFNGDITVI